MPGGGLLISRDYIYSPSRFQVRMQVGLVPESLHFLGGRGEESLVDDGSTQFYYLKGPGSALRCEG